MTTTTREADILEVIADLSNDEVFTSPRVADLILDQLPSHVWTDPALKWLDPGTKSGVFLRQAARRLMVGLEPHFPDAAERLAHILTNMLYGTAITELTSLMARRSLYCSRDATGEHSVVKLPTAAGNIWWEPASHRFRNERCVECGATRKQFDHTNTSKNHTYGFIHQTTREKIERTIGMKFDIIVGNPPYQLEDGGHAASSSPIYNLFVEQAIKLDPRYIAMVIPSRWFAGGKGLDKFRERMLKDTRLTRITDYPTATEVFPQVEIKGGVCYFLWEREPANPDGLCDINIIDGGETISAGRRSLQDNDVLIRNEVALQILGAVRAAGEPAIEQQVSSRKPFGFPTNFTDYAPEQSTDTIAIHARGKVGWIERDRVTINPHWIDKWKIITSRAYGAGEGFPHQIMNTPIVAAPPSCCTETYLVAGTYDTQQEAEHFAAYMRTKFFRFLVSLRKNTQDMSQARFSFVPQIQLDRAWTDEELYNRYNLTTEQREHIETMIKEMAA